MEDLHGPNLTAFEQKLFRDMSSSQEGRFLELGFLGVLYAVNIRKSRCQGHKFRYVHKHRTPTSFWTHLNFVQSDIRI